MPILTERLSIQFQQLSIFLPQQNNITCRQFRVFKGDTIIITADASDADGEISSVSFYNGTELLSTVNESPYTYTIINAEKGSYSFFCVAVDDSGASAFSDTITVTVSDVPNILPTVKIESPADGAEFKTGDDIKIIATASDNDGEIASVIYNGTVAGHY